jgi:hypothetical protein
MAEPFFLDSDEAKSMGDIDYMRTARKVKKSFPGTTAWGSAFNTESEVSATSKLNGSGQNASQPDPFQVYENPQESQTSRRKGAADLDMFRSMAKDLRKS